MKTQSQYLTDYRFCNREFVIHEKILTRQELQTSKGRCSSVSFRAIYNELKRKYVHEAVDI